MRDNWRKRTVQAGIVAAMLLLFGRSAAQMDLLANAFQQEIEDCLAEDCLPVVMLSQESGDYEFVGKPALWAAQYAVDEINRQGGVNGCEVRLVVGNTDSDRTRALSLYRGAQNTAVIVLGPADAPETAYIAQQSEGESAIHLAAYSYAESRQQAAPFGISYMSDSENGELSAVRRWAAQNPDIHNVVVFTSYEDESKKSTAELFQESLPELGLTILDIVDVRSGADEAAYRSYVVQALNQKADGYVFLLSGEDYANILVELRRRGVDEGRRITASFSAFYSETFERAGDALDGTYIWNKLDPAYDGEEWMRLTTAYNRSELGGELPGHVVSDYYDAVTAICECYEAFGITAENYADYLHREEIAEWFYDSESRDGIQGSYRWEEGQKIMDYQYFVFEGSEPVNRN